MLASVIAAALSFSMPADILAPRPPALPDARPALWVVNDHDTIIYLFGTFHALDGKAAWFNDEVRTAFGQSEALVLETVVPQSLTARPRPAAANPAPIPAVAGSPSFLSSAKLVMAAGRSQGMSTAKGADVLLREAADQAGKSVEGLESFHFQMNMFARLPGAPRPSSPTDTRAATTVLGTLLARLQAAWNRGDSEAFAPLLAQMRVKSPDSYRLMFEERNSRWAQWIAGRLDQPGTVFVAVGAGHLSGSDSVQRKLAALGVRSARIN